MVLTPTSLLYKNRSGIAIICKKSEHNWWHILRDSFFENRIDHIKKEQGGGNQNHGSDNYCGM